MTTAIVSLSSDEILALSSAPKQLVAAPGVGKAIVPTDIIVSYRYVTTSYNYGTVRLAHGGVGGAPIGNLFGGSVSYLISDKCETDDATSVFENKALQLAADADFTGGDGTATVIINYEVIDV